MLLASSITPSGRAWALDSARASLPGASVLDCAQYLNGRPAIAGAFQLDGALAVSPDVTAGLTSLRRASALATAWSRSHGGPVVAWFPASVADSVADLLSLAALVELSDLSSANDQGLRELVDTASAIQRGDIELLLVCPPEESAVADAVTEVAAASVSGLRVRGVGVCPMPRKSDGWPKSIRLAAREFVDDLAQVLHPIAVHRTRAGVAPTFIADAVDVSAPTVTTHSDGRRIWSITIPGLSRCDLAIGAWSSDSAYPTTHVVLDISGRQFRRQVDSTLRRCEPVDVVVSGDSIAITFEPVVEQWPQSRSEDAPAGGNDG